MAKRQVQCAHCERAFEVDEGVALASLTCPFCNAIVTLPPSESQPAAESRPKLTLKRDEAVSGTLKRCPLCDASAPADAVICLTCGFDWRTGRQQRLQFRSPALRPWRALVLLGLAVAVAAAAYVYLQKKSGAPLPPAPATEEPEPTAAPPEPATPAGSSAGTASPATQAPTESATEQPPSPGEAELTELAAQAAAFREQITRAMDLRAPMYEKESPVAFRMANGIVHRGTYLGVKGEAAVLQQEQEVLEIPLKELDRETRMRCDEAYRGRYIEFLVAKRMRQAGSAAQPTGF